MKDADDRSIMLLATALSQARRAVALTGAGISTESGIPDFRSPGGVWSRHAPVLYDDFLRDAGERRRYWQIRKETIPGFMAARPNLGHLVLARLEAAGRLRAVVTQNIDELHQRAGSRRVLELHGTAMKVQCLECDRRYSGEEVQARLETGEQEPVCDSCGGILKSMTVSFGQPLPPGVWMEAVQEARGCDLFLVLGSSLMVQPAASLPETAVRHGARLFIVNRDPTPLDALATGVVRASIGPTMEAAMKALGELGSEP